MYGAMADSSLAANNPPFQPLEDDNDRYPAGTAASAAAQPPVHQRGLSRVPSVRNGPVLTLLLDKQHYKKQQGEIPNAAAVGGGLNLDLMTENPRPKSFVYTMLNPRSDAWQAVAYKWFIAIVIITDVVSFVISTEPNLSEYQNEVLDIWEGVTSTIFLLEYMTRLWVVLEAHKYREQGPIWGRLSYARTTPALIDFLATIPFFVELTTGWDLPTLTYLRAFRLLRILKTSGMAEATRAVYRVIYYNRQILYVALLLCVGLVLVTAVLMYYLRPHDPDHSQAFQSLGSTMYLATLMLTGQGGPDGEMPWYTKGVVLLTGVFSIGMFAIPASMLTWGFEAEAERMAQLAYARQKKPDTGTDQDNWSFSSDDYSTDEEYRRIIAGDLDEGEDEDQDAEARKAFTLADIDQSGSISLSEYLALSREQAAANANHQAGKQSDLVNPLLNARLNALEKRIDTNTKTLDKICSLLEGMQHRG